MTTPELIEELEDLAQRLRTFFPRAERPNTHRVAFDLIEEAVKQLEDYSK